MHDVEYDSLQSVVENMKNENPIDFVGPVQAWFPDSEIISTDIVHSDDAPEIFIVLRIWNSVGFRIKFTIRSIKNKHAFESINCIFTGDGSSPILHKLRLLSNNHHFRGFVFRFDSNWSEIPTVDAALREAGPKIYEWYNHVCAMLLEITMEEAL